MADAEEQSAVCENQLKENERKELIAAKAQELFSEELWGMDHALFWAATRDRQAMAEYFASPERAVFGETFRDMQFAVLIHRLNRLGIERRASLEDLVKAARQGAIAIEGKKNGASDWTVIPSRNWAGGPSPGGLEIFENCARGPYASEPETPHRTVWTKLRVSRQQVMDAFPEQEPDPNRRLPGEKKNHFLLRRIVDLKENRSAAEFRELARDWLDPGASDEQVKREGKLLANSWRKVRIK